MPVRVEIGPKDIDKQQAVLVSRLDRKKSFVPWDKLAEELKLPPREDPGRAVPQGHGLPRREHPRRGAPSPSSRTPWPAAAASSAAAGAAEPTAKPRSRPTAAATIRVILDKPEPAAKTVRRLRQRRAAHRAVRQILLNMDDPFAEQRRDMVERQLRARGIRDEAVLRAMGKVPRELFVEEGLRESSYADGPLPIGCGQTISQPYIVAYMTEQLELRGRRNGAGDRHRLGLPGRRAGRDRRPGLHAWR